VRRAERHAGLRHPGAAVRARDGEGDAEVGDQCVAAVEQDVLRFDIAVDHAAFVRVGQRIGHFARDPHGVVHGELVLPL
jgi:hypothetical protein